MEQPKRKLSEETKRKIGDGNRGKIISEEQRLQISEALRGRKKSAEHKAKISEAMRGKPWSAKRRLALGRQEKRMPQGYIADPFFDIYAQIQDIK